MFEQHVLNMFVLQAVKYIPSNAQHLRSSNWDLKHTFSKICNKFASAFSETRNHFAIL